MRNWMSVVLMAIATAACHPRYVPLDERGVGGSGSLDSIRARVLACIAARDYDQAREYLKLAANMSEEEQARFEQMISAAERELVPSWRERCRISSRRQMGTSRKTRRRLGS